MRAFITGISGQDGSYLAEHLLSLGYEVHGLLRRHSNPEGQDARISRLKGVITHYGDVTDEVALPKLIKEIDPQEVYNLAAMSHVRISFDMPAFTLKTNGLGVLNVLEAVKSHNPGIKLYQASSSEMFGNSVDEDGCQRLTTAMSPVSPYGCSKVLGYNLVRHYRKAYGMHACNGILFNHESPRRGSNFVTTKVVKTAVEIKKNLASKLELGNLDSKRDWGHSKDYVRAMHLIVNHDVADDFIVATGETRSIRDLCEYAFGKLGLDYKDFVTQNPKYMRPEELNYLRGDPSKAQKVLGWKPTYTFESMLDEMIDHWSDIL
jgi:GDPmannose 4,6-dehydratase